MDNKKFSDKVAPYLALFILCCVLVVLSLKPYTLLLTLFLMPSIFIYAKKKVNVRVPIIPISILVLICGLIALFSNWKNIFVFLIPLLINSLVFIYSYKKNLSYKILLPLMIISTLIGTTIALFYYLNILGYEFYQFLEILKQKLKGIFELNIALNKNRNIEIVRLFETVKNSLNNNKILALVVSYIVSFSTITGFLTIFVAKKWILKEEENLKSVPSIQNYKVNPFILCILLFILVICIFIERKLGIKDNIVLKIGEEQLSLVSDFILFSAIVSRVKKGVFKNKYIFFSIIMWIIIEPLAQIFTILDSVFDFRNITGKSLYFYIKSKLFTEGD